MMYDYYIKIGKIEILSVDNAPLWFARMCKKSDVSDGVIRPTRRAVDLKPAVAVKVKSYVASNH